MPVIALLTIEPVRIDTAADRLCIRLLKITRAGTNNLRTGILVRVRIVIRGVVLLVSNGPGRGE